MAFGYLIMTSSQPSSNVGTCIVSCIDLMITSGITISRCAFLYKHSSKGVFIKIQTFRQGKFDIAYKIILLLAFFKRVESIIMLFPSYKATMAVETN